jgi:hypothetical protein
MAVPVIKELNSSGLVQFKFAMDVVWCLILLIK